MRLWPLVSLLLGVLALPADATSRVEAVARPASPSHAASHAAAPSSHAAAQGPLQQSLCYARASDRSVTCAVDLQAVSLQLKESGPKQLPPSQLPLPPIPTRISSFLHTYCTHQSDKYVCLIHVGQTAKMPPGVVQLVVDDNYWAIMGAENEACLDWFVDSKLPYFKSGALQASVAKCPYRGTDYAFMRMGIASLLPLNIIASDSAQLPCKGGHVLASPLYLLAKGYTFYESMYGKAFVGKGYDGTEVAAARAMGAQQVSAAARAQLQEVVQYVDSHMHKPVTWGSIAAAILELCRDGGGARLAQRTMDSWDGLMSGELAEVRFALDSKRFEIAVVAAPSV